MADDGSQQRKPNSNMVVEDVKAIATVVAMEAESVLGRRAARLLGVLVLFALVVGTLLAFLDWYIGPSGAEQKQALVVTVAQILGGTALISGLYFTWRTLQVNREGQITERFTRAIDQLGKVEDGQKLYEIRVGGIYALERIARESEEDYWPIMEILTALLPKGRRATFYYVKRWPKFFREDLATVLSLRAEGKIGARLGRGYPPNSRRQNPHRGLLWAGAGLFHPRLWPP